MGNYGSSCKLASSSLMINSSRSAKVILPTGKIQQFRQPVQAAEVMMETPNFFIVNAKSLKIGRRFSPLNADEDLVRGNVYVMFAMQRKNSVVTENDVGVLLMRAGSAVKRGGRVQPEDEEEEAALPRLSLEGVEEPQFVHRLSFSRSKRPLLETIDEEPIARK